MTGPAKEAYEVSRRLEEYGYLSPIFTTTAKNATSPNQEGQGRVETRRFPVTFRFMSFDLSLPFAKAILKEPWDLVHSHGYRDFLALHSFIAAGLRRKPFIIQPHGSLVGYRYMNPREQWHPYTGYDRLCRRVVVEADKVVVSTNLEAREAMEFGVDRSKVAIIPPGAPVVEQGRPRDGSGFRVLFVGRISQARNVHRIIEAFSQVKADKDAFLTIVGAEEKLGAREESGYLGRLMKAARSSRNGEQMQFTGPMYGPDLETMYFSSHLFVCASRYESFGLPIIEAAAHGLPVISTPVGVANDIVINGKTGYLVEANDVAGFADRIQELLYDRKRAEEMGVRIRQIVREKFDWNHTIREYVSLYESVS